MSDETQKSKAQNATAPRGDATSVHRIFDIVEKVKQGRKLDPNDLAMIARLRGEPNVARLAEKICSDYLDTLRIGLALERYQVKFLVAMGKMEDPRKTPRTAAERMQDMGNRRSEVSQFFYAPKEPERKERCRYDFLAFCREYATGGFEGALLDHEPSEDIASYARELQAAILGEGGDGLVLIVIPRGTGKTSLKELAGIWAVSYGHRKFLVVLGANEDNANIILEDVWNFVENNDRYAEDFPEVSVPIRKLQGIIQRCQSQTYKGVRTRIQKKGDRIHFPVVEGSPASGAVIVARGIHSGFRGLKKGKIRPDFLLLDDLQTRESAKSDTQTSDLEKKIQGDIMGLAGHGKKIAGVMSLTPIEAFDLCERYMDADAYPSWRRVTYPFVKAWPVATELWDEYLELRRMDILKGGTSFTMSSAFYAEHFDAMNEGAKVIDPLAYDKTCELSAIQHAYNLRQKVGNAAFMAEYQLAPEKPDSALELSAKDVAACISGTPHMTLPDGFYSAVAYVDCMNKDGLRWMVLGVGSMRRAIILGYGRWPEKGNLYPKDATVHDQERLFARNLRELAEHLRDMPIKLAGGYIRVGVIGVDRNWRTGPVDVMANRSDLRGILQAVRGTATEKFLPTRDNGERRAGVIALGDNCFEFHSKTGKRYLASHSSYWKEYAQRCFLQPALLSGSVCFYGNDPLAHHACACEIVAQQLAFKGHDRDGRLFWRWKTRSTGVADHFLDCLAQCFMLASWKGYLDTRQVTAVHAAKQRMTQKRRVRAKLV